MLLSFAQFEREVIGERVRDKIAGSKKKGIWVGGLVPLGYASVNKKVVIVPDDAEKVRTIFRRYLALGSITALAQDLEHQGIRTRRQVLSNGKIRGDIPFGVGPLADLLKNRFLIGEVVYRGEVYRGEHEPILDRALFNAVQDKLAARAVARRNKLRGSPAILMGRIFDDQGNRMSPTHSNKRGVRYRYYVSHAAVHGRKANSGKVPRVSCTELETAVVSALRQQVQLPDVGGETIPNSARELIERYVDRIVVKADTIEVWWSSAVRQNEHSAGTHDLESENKPAVAVLPWTPPLGGALKGVVCAPADPATMKPGNRDALLEAIAKARLWIDDMVKGRVRSLAEIAHRERKVERHIRLLAPLAFVAPEVISAILDGAASPVLKLTTVATGLPPLWTEQVKKFGC
jgi:hypothetical protein